MQTCERSSRSLSRTKESDSPTEELDQFLRSTKQSYSNIVRVEGVLTEDVQQESLVSSKAGFLLLRLAAVGWWECLATSLQLRLQIIVIS